MNQKVLSIFDQEKVDALANEKVKNVIQAAFDLMKPDRVMVFDDSPQDIAMVRQLAIDYGEEKILVMEGHTIHYDGFYDQARDK